MEMPFATRRELLLAPLLVALPEVLAAGTAAAAPDPSMTIVRLPAQLTWSSQPGFPANSVETAPLWSKTSERGLYYVLVKWHPGFMSAPHWYEEDRYCVVVSGTWWVTSGAKFDPESTVPVPAGGFVRRVARTPHYDGVKKGGKEPAVIAICGMGPITFHNAEPGTKGWREL